MVYLVICVNVDCKYQQVCLNLRQNKLKYYFSLEVERLHSAQD
jgi:hypothetical protein